MVERQEFRWELAETLGRLALGSGGLPDPLVGWQAHYPGGQVSRRPPST